MSALQTDQVVHRPRTAGQITLRHVGMSFARGKTRQRVLDDIHLDIAPGEFVSFIGPSGCGKSTLLNLVSGMVQADEGRIAIDGTPVTEPGPVCNVVFQQHSLFPWMTALDNVAFGPQQLGLPEPKKIARDLLKMVGLEQAASAYPAALSGGMQQRVAIARALSTRPTVLLMDEPFGALDAQTRHIMQEELLKIWSRFHTTVVFITHDIDEAIYLSDRVVVMSTQPGAIKQQVSVDLPRPRAPEVIHSAAFGALRTHLGALIREETLKVFNV